MTQATEEAMTIITKSHGGTDPHVWISPKVSQNLALSIKNSLVEAAPEQKENFEKNYEQLITELQKLDADYEEIAHNAPTKHLFPMLHLDNRKHIWFRANCSCWIKLTR